MRPRAKVLGGIGVAALLVAGCAGSVDGGTAGADGPALTIDSFDGTGALVAHTTVDDQLVLVDSRVTTTDAGQTRITTLHTDDGTVVAELDSALLNARTTGSYDGHSYGHPEDATDEKNADLWSGIADSFAGHAALAVSRASTYASLVNADAHDTLVGIAKISDALENLAAGQSLTAPVGTESVGSGDEEDPGPPDDPAPAWDDDVALDSGSVRSAAPQFRAGSSAPGTPIKSNEVVGDLAAQYQHQLKTGAVSRVFRAGNAFVKVDLSGRIWGNAHTHKAAAVGSQQVTAVSGHPYATMRYGYGNNNFYIGVEDLGKGKTGNLVVRGAINAGSWRTQSKTNGKTLNIELDGYVKVGHPATTLGVGIRLSTTIVPSGPGDAPRLTVPVKYLVPAAAALTILKLLELAGESFALDFVF